MALTFEPWPTKLYQLIESVWCYASLWCSSTRGRMTWPVRAGTWWSGSVLNKYIWIQPAFSENVEKKMKRNKNILSILFSVLGLWFTWAIKDTSHTHTVAVSVGTFLPFMYVCVLMQWQGAMNMCKQVVTIVTVAAGDKLSASALICVSLGSVSGIKKPKCCYYSLGLGGLSHILSHTTL